MNNGQVESQHSLHQDGIDSLVPNLQSIEESILV